MFKETTFVQNLLFTALLNILPIPIRGVFCDHTIKSFTQKVS